VGGRNGASVGGSLLIQFPLASNPTHGPVTRLEQSKMKSNSVAEIVVTSQLLHMKISLGGTRSNSTPILQEQVSTVPGTMGSHATTR
jgi:hypothetical protein